MLKVCLVDANDRTAAVYRGTPMSVVSGWLRWEMGRKKIEPCEPQDADLVFLVHAGALDWLPKCRAEIKRYRIEPRAERRAGAPYVIAGGQVATTPLTCLQVADAVVVGEGYRAVRRILEIVAGGGGVPDLRRFLEEYPHALERSQLAGIGRDPDRPWLMDCNPGALAEPDPWVDWRVPPVKSDDRVVRVIGAKGCARKCLFCATSWCQKFQVNPNSEHVLGTLNRLAAAGERVQLVSNDPSQIPYYRLVKVRLDSESYTVKEGL